MNEDTTGQPVPERSEQEPEQPEAAGYEESLPTDEQEAYAEEELEELLPALPPVIWTANDFVDPSKTYRWYVGVGVVSVVLAVLVYLLTKDKISAATMIMVGGMLAVIATRKPRETTYKVERSLLTVGSKTYDLDGFRSFAVLRENSAHSIVLHPFKRFMPLVTLYYKPEDEERIVEAMSNHLPVEDRNHDLIDQFLHKIKL